jgi:SRSO17 transposase
MPGVRDWEGALSRWLEPFLEALGHEARRRWAPVYIRGLFGRTERKSVQPIAAELTPGDHDQLHNFVAGRAWDAAPLEAALAAEADRLVGGPDALLVIDDTALPKKGVRSVGVAPQYAGALGKNANCQVLVTLTLARHEVPVPVAMRLFLPDEWTSDPERCRRVGVPEARLAPRTKPELAIEGLDRLRGLGVRFGCVLADAGYGMSAASRRALEERGLDWAVGIPCTRTVYTPAVELTWPTARTGRPRKRAVPSEDPVACAAMLAAAPWRRVAWRTGTRGALAGEFAAMRVRVADGPLRRDGRHLPGDEAWLVGERRASGETRYYLSNLPPGTPLEVLAARVEARWVCEQAHRQMKEELGLDHFEGRGWHGLHHHAALVMVALAFLQHLRLAEAARGGSGRRRRPAASADAACRPARDPRAHARGRPDPMPLLPELARAAQARVELPR